MIGSEWIDLALAQRLCGLSQKHLRELIRSGDLDGYDGRRTGARRARWLVTRESVFGFVNARRAGAKDLPPGTPGGGTGTSEPADPA